MEPGKFQIGLQADLAGGTVPALSFEEGGRNVLEIVVAGDSAGFSVNGVFVSELNASQLAARRMSGSDPDSIKRMLSRARSRGLKTSQSGRSRRLRSQSRPPRRRRLPRRSQVHAGGPATPVAPAMPRQRPLPVRSVTRRSRYG